MFKVIKKIAAYPRLTQDYPEQAPDTSLWIGAPEIDRERCTLCGVCVSRCPSRAIEPGGTGISIRYDQCVFCTLCETVCPVQAVRMGQKFELAEGKREKLTDRPPIVIGEDYPLDLEQALKSKIKRMFGRSLQIREVDAGSCNGCDYEIDAMNNPFNDIERLGIHFVASPRHADLLLVTGTATRNMELALRKTYEATPDPKLVVAVGACACSGGIFRDSYATRNGIDTVVPVDVYVPGCPPRPQAILYGILKALDRV